MKDIAVMGAGIYGLIAAKQLGKYTRVQAFEKSLGVGGRISTCSMREQEFDHGTQFFTVRGDRLRNFLKSYLEAGTLQE